MILTDMQENIKSLNIPDNQKEDLMVLLAPSFDFRTFLKNKLQITDNEVETLISKHIEANKEGLNNIKILDIDEYAEKVVIEMTNIISNFAKSYEYEHIEALEMSISKLMLLGLKQNN